VRIVSRAPTTPMERALAEAEAAAARGEVPVGAVLLGPAGELLAAAGNRVEELGDPTAHAEVLALRDAARARGSWRLDGCILVVTLEPCPMCAGAALAARVSEVAYGTRDPKAGALESLYTLGSDPRLNHAFSVHAGVRAEESAALLTSFFAPRRRPRNPTPPPNA